MSSQWKSFIGSTRTETADVGLAADLAWQAFLTYRHISGKDRARFLRKIAEEIEAASAQIVPKYVEESHLPEARANGELARTAGQLRLFATVAEEGKWRDPRIETAIPDRQPLPKPDMRSLWIALGPVAVFGASNFPLAFSVAGGDTASALAAGCPVIVKAHPAHPGVSEIVADCVLRAAKATGMPEGVFSMLYNDGFETGQALVQHPKIKAVGFTGSQRGGLALWRLAQARSEPIPVYAEMGSVNPSFLLPAILATNSDGLAKTFATGITMGVGQFCTNPGLIVTVGPAAAFVKALEKYLSEYIPTPMLTPGIAAAYAEGVKARSEDYTVAPVLKEGAALFVTEANRFIANPHLQEELFGPATLVVICKDAGEANEVAECLEGQLTASLHGTEGDLLNARSLFQALELKAGRLIVNQLPTGLEVCSATVHGGPFPATTDSRTTSVGSMAIQRWARPICYQNTPADLLPDALC
jgi:alpha-ketoglutaric semialdehyde dehydrogenase